MTRKTRKTLILLGIEIDNKLNFEKHVTVLCWEPGRQLMLYHGYVIPLHFSKWKRFLTILYSQILTIVSLCDIYALLPCRKSTRIEKVQDRALYLLSSDNYSNYISLLLKLEQSKMEVNRMWDLAIEASKILKSLNAGFKRTHFKKCSHSARKKMI